MDERILIFRGHTYRQGDPVDWVDDAGNLHRGVFAFNDPNNRRAFIRSGEPAGNNIGQTLVWVEYENLSPAAMIGFRGN